MDESSNILDLDLLQSYVDTTPELHETVGAEPGTPLNLRPFAQGEYNVNFAFDVPNGKGSGQFLLRVNLGSQMHLEHQIEYEMDALRLLEPSGRVPRVYYVDGSRNRFPFGVGVEERLPGRALRYQDDLDEAAAILADVHAVEVPGECSLLRPSYPVAAIVDECSQMFDVYRKWASANPALVTRIDKLFVQANRIADRDRNAGVPSRVHVVNTEVNSSNFLVNPGAQSYLIDWEKPVLGEVAQDLAHFLVPTTTYWKTDTIFTRANVDDFVERYVRAVNDRFPTNDLRDRLNDYLVVTCLRGLTWCAMAYTEYTAGNRAAANADTFAKIKEYLEDPFLALVEQEYYA